MSKGGKGGNASIFGNRIVVHKLAKRSLLNARIPRIARRIRMIERTVRIYIRPVACNIDITAPTAAAVTKNALCGGKLLAR